MVQQHGYWWAVYQASITIEAVLQPWVLSESQNGLAGDTRAHTNRWDQDEACGYKCICYPYDRRNSSTIYVYDAKDYWTDSEAQPQTWYCIIEPKIIPIYNLY